MAREADAFSASRYDPASITRHFDDFAGREWERLVRTPADEVSLHVHTQVLAKHLGPGRRVLEIGAGPGRFTQVLASLGASIVVADISPVQLELNRRFAGKFGFDRAVEAWQQADICDLARWAAGAFDAVVAYGGPFSYVLDRRDAALAECLRVLRPGGLLFASVMALWGSAHVALPGVLTLPPAANRAIVETGDITAATFPGRTGQFMHLFRAGELRGWLAAAGLEILEISASSCLSTTWNEALAQIRDNAETWNDLLRIEVEASADAACLGMGTHLIAVARV
jgi:2-polyprenyl-3-methyl-5-hydroxy-6-metoxy-1,4-benzoquinol methylase